MTKPRVIVFAWSISDVLFYTSLLSDAEVHFVCGRLSSYLYAKLNFDNVYPLYSSYRIVQQKMKHQRASHEEMCCYDFKFYSDEDAILNVNIDELEEDVLRIFGNRKFDLLLLPGEFRLREQILKCFKPAGLPIVYWEAGPVGSVYFSASGTNARANLLRVYGDGGVEGLIKSYSVGVGPRLGNIRLKFVIPLLKFIEYCYLLYSVFVNGSKEFIDFLPNMKSVDINVGNQTRVEDSNIEGYIIFYGQVEKDVNYTHFAPDIADLREVFLRWKREYYNYKLILKPHPRESSNMVNNLLADIFSDSIELYCDKHKKLSEDADNVHHVTINSNIIAELLQQGKTVVVLGETLYAGLPGIVSNLSESKLPSDIIAKAIEQFLRDCFFPYDYRQKKWRNYTGMTNVLLEIASDKHD